MLTIIWFTYFSYVVTNQEFFRFFIFLLIIWRLILFLLFCIVVRPQKNAAYLGRDINFRFNSHIVIIKPSLAAPTEEPGVGPRGGQARGPPGLPLPPLQQSLLHPQHVQTAHSTA